METTWLELISERRMDIWLKTLEHLQLAGVSVGLAVIVGVPLGILIMRVPLLRGPVLNATGVIQTIPSLALLGFLLPLLGLGTTPALVALTLYALLPIVRNTYTGLSGLPPEIIEAARGMGFTRTQRLWLVDLPLALPVIVAGVRTAAVITVGVATLAAFIGAGGLGYFIFRGISMGDNKLILLGATFAAILALLIDFLIGRIERWLDPVSKSRKEQGA